jgi:hypothetical protein
MLKSIGAMTLAVILTASMAAAGQSKPAAEEKGERKVATTAAKVSLPEPAGLPTNIKIDVSITDQTGNSPAARKVVTMIASDRQSANVRSSASVPVKAGPGPEPLGIVNYRNVTINVDARPAIVVKDPNKISVSFGLEYMPKTLNTKEEMEPGMTSWSERLTLTLESGKPMIISQAADPTSDRKITVEITATILK